MLLIAKYVWGLSGPKTALNFPFQICLRPFLYLKPVFGKAPDKSYPATSILTPANMLSNLVQLNHKYVITLGAT